MLKLKIFFVTMMLCSSFAYANTINVTSSQAIVRQYDTVDLLLHSNKNYSIYSPWFNPFTEITLSLELHSPSGQSLVVPGFFDGDGAGGNSGSVFKIRLCPNEPGKWTWKTASTLAELNHKSGSFHVSGTIKGGFKRGPITVDKTNPKKFAFADQRPHFLLGKFLDKDEPLHMRYTHTLFSEQWSEAQRTQFVDHQRSMAINKLNIYLANKGDYGGIATTPWLGTAAMNIKSRFDLQRWHQYETWVERLRNQGILAHLWFFADDSDFGSLKDSDREQLISFAMARLSGYVNTMFTLALEWQEDFSEAQIRKSGLLTQRKNPWKRLISVHGQSVTDNINQSTTLFDENWLDFIEIQTGFVGHKQIYRLGMVYREQEKKPVVLEEFSFGENTDAQRINTWAAILTIPAGIGTGSGLTAIANFLRHVDITKFQPAPKLITSDNAYVASTKAGQIIVYVFKAGPVALTQEIINSCKGRWFDPRKGQFVGEPFDLNTVETLIAPTNTDWVLLVEPITTST